MGWIRLLRNPIRDYAWGSRTALAEWMGRASPAAGPEAELWMGAHPSAPSRVSEDGDWVSLVDWIARAPGPVLGEEVSRRFGAELPFLFKVLAPECALSLQTHPGPQQAREGFARENAAGLAPDDPRRSYRDPHPKPELICALERFEALCGFRHRDEIEAGLQRLGVARLAPHLEALRTGEPAQGLAALLEGLLGLSPDARRALARDAAAAAAPAAAVDRASAWVVELARQFPEDPGVLAPLLLNLLDLEPGQALFLPAGELHAYLGGVGIELMANSDNVLRGGLTAKHVDVPELMRTLTFREGPPEVLEPRTLSAGLARYETPAEEFVLSVLRPAKQAPVPCSGSGAIEILLCARGEVRLLVADEEPVVLACGASAVVPASAGAYQVAGEGLVYRAGVPM